MPTWSTCKGKLSFPLSIPYTSAKNLSGSFYHQFIILLPSLLQCQERHDSAPFRCLQCSLAHSAATRGSRSQCQLQGFDGEVQYSDSNLFFHNPLPIIAIANGGCFAGNAIFAGFSLLPLNIHSVLLKRDVFALSRDRPELAFAVQRGLALRKEEEQRIKQARDREKEQKEERLRAKSGPEAESNREKMERKKEKLRQEEKDNELRELQGRKLENTKVLEWGERVLLSCCIRFLSLGPPSFLSFDYFFRMCVHGLCNPDSGATCLPSRTTWFERDKRRKQRQR